MKNRICLAMVVVLGVDTAIVVAATSSRSITGQVLDAQDGKALANVTVKVCQGFEQPCGPSNPPCE